MDMQQLLTGGSRCPFEQTDSLDGDQVTWRLQLTKPPLPQPFPLHHYLMFVV